MDYSKPTLLVISGPNGSGKSTQIQSMLPFSFAGILSFDRDLTRSTFEKNLALEGVDKDLISLKAMRLMEDVLLKNMNEAIQNSKHFVLETPLSHPDYWKYIDLFENHGYQVQLNYLCLNTIKDCEVRVQQRVMEGGHFVDARTIKGVYETNLKYINEYLSTFKQVNLYDGTMAPVLLVKAEDNLIIFADDEALRKNWIRMGLPAIAQKVARFLEA
jgi:predicted ABC-type ATPase